MQVPFIILSPPPLHPAGLSSALCKCQNAIEVSDNSGMQMCFWCFLEGRGGFEGFGGGVGWGRGAAQSAANLPVWIAGIKTLFSIRSLFFWATAG